MSVATWPEALERAHAAAIGAGRVVVLLETDSTQDAARRLHSSAGDVVVAARQRQGRGRLGRAWADTGEQGIAMTLVVAAPVPASERLAMAAGVGVAEAVAGLVPAGGPRVGIKWPNDIVAEGRKLAGILIEQSGGAALIGVGVNVRQERWPPELAGRAVSLRQLGAACTRLETLLALVETLPATLARNAETLEDAFVSRDVLAGTVGVFRSGNRRYAGRVLRVDPLRGLALEIDGREVWLPAATTSTEAAEEPAAAESDDSQTIPYPLS